LIGFALHLGSRVKHASLSNEEGAHSDGELTNGIRVDRIIQIINPMNIFLARFVSGTSFLENNFSYFV
jgi:hypothetical protein